MGFRNPATTATAVQTARSGERATLHQTTTTVGGTVYSVGELDFTNPDGSDGGAVGSVALSSAGGAALGGKTTVRGGTWNGITAPRLELGVRSAPAGGYQPYAEVAGGTALDLVVAMTALPYDSTKVAPYGGGTRAPVYCLTASGLVIVTGTLKTTSAWGNGTVLATLPAGCRPSASEQFVLLGANDRPWRCDVASNGQLIFTTVAASDWSAPLGSYLSLAGIAFPAEQ